jgi:peroxiredoxin
VVGQTAPDFSLYDSSKKLVQLSAQKGTNVLLLFFPFAFSRVCTVELCSVRDDLDKYQDLEVKPFGISVDSLYTLARYKEEQHLNYELLSDFNKEVSSLYGSLHHQFSYNMKGVSKRSAFIVDKEGIVQYAEVLENPELQPDFEEISVKLRALNR